MNMYKLDSGHLLQDPLAIPNYNVIERLIRQSQFYKVGVQHSLNTQNESLRIRNLINRMDYLLNIKDKDSSFNVELSYTMLDWRIMDLLDHGKLDIEEVAEKLRLQLCFNILPDGSSYLHRLAQARSDEQNDLIKSVTTSKGLFDIARKHTDLLITGAEGGCTFEIPLMPDIYGLTALDYCLGLYSNYDNLFVTDDRDKESLIEIENIAMAEVLFEGIKSYNFMHCSHFISEAVIKATSLGLDSVKAYLDSQLCTIDHSFIS